MVNITDMYHVKLVNETVHLKLISDEIREEQSVFSLMQKQERKLSIKSITNSIQKNCRL